jgi:putative colanic acid biosynthesis acetyltransferase WcaF
MRYRDVMQKCGELLSSVKNGAGSTKSDDRCRRLAIEGTVTFPFRHRFDRLVWKVVWVLLAAWTPVALHCWRVMLLRAFGARIHSTAHVYPSARVWYPPNLSMGQHACLGSGVDCYCMTLIELEDFAIISQGARLCAGTHDIDDPIFPLVTRPIRIGSRAWIAAEAFVGPGVTVGEGAVLGARGVAFHNLLPWTVYVGNPARKIRERKFQISKE